jgi:hypothetical protein
MYHACMIDPNRSFCFFCPSRLCGRVVNGVITLTVYPFSGFLTKIGDVYPIDRVKNVRRLFYTFKDVFINKLPGLKAIDLV